MEDIWEWNWGIGNWELGRKWKGELPKVQQRLYHLLPPPRWLSKEASETREFYNSNKHAVRPHARPPLKGISDLGVFGQVEFWVPPKVPKGRL